MFLFRYQNLINVTKFCWKPGSQIPNVFFQMKRHFSMEKTSDIHLETSYELRPMREDDISQMIRLRRELTFQDSVSSYEICRKVDPEAFLVAAKEDGRIVGFGSIKNCSGSLSYGGCMTIHPDYWKVGLGKKMVTQHLSRVGNRSVHTMAEPHIIPFYLPYFNLIEKEYVIIEFESQEEINSRNLSFGNQPTAEVKQFHEDCLSAILEFDRKVIGFDRKEDVTLNCLDVYGRTVVATSGSKCIGYGSIKLNIQGAGKVGPLYAENPAVAEAMLKKLLESFAYGKGFAVSVPSNNLEAVKMFGKLGRMKTVAAFRMSYKERFTLDPTPVYALFDGEFHPF